MSQTATFIQRLQSLKEGERSRLRRLAGQPLDETLSGFDLFTGLWWPLREKNQFAPRRETSWLVAKLYGAFPITHLNRDEKAVCPTLARLLGRCEPPHTACQHAALLSSAPPDREPARRQFLEARRYRRRFDALLQSTLSGLEPHLRWALSVVTKAVAGRVRWVTDVSGVDWVQLLDDLSIWDRAEEHRRERDIRDIWAEAYLGATCETSHQRLGASHAD
jgi:hypothetical protein